MADWHDELQQFFEDRQAANQREARSFSEAAADAGRWRNEVAKPALDAIAAELETHGRQTEVTVKDQTGNAVSEHSVLILVEYEGKPELRFNLAAHVVGSRTYIRYSHLHGGRVGEGRIARPLPSSGDADVSEVNADRVIRTFLDSYRSAMTRD